MVYSGRAVLSDWIYHTKKIGKLQSKLAGGRHTSRRIQLLFSRRQRRLKHAVNAMVQNIFQRLEEEKMDVLVIGDLNGIRNGNDKGRKTNQKVHNFWVFNLIKKRIMELGEEHGVTVRKVSEKTPPALAASAGGNTAAGLRED